ncbi:hypothetical protein [Pseudohongiella sp.]|uniref:Uncharacterized protein n=1 Tax=marine sediment metagenome TaxID=412755 RepID=A0A0F9WGL6_9ZZZZ|nr:hypothetical protein [Pseudohongiella sp.]HDZ09169.1 hypothetical protein [Pseudohongiella sp.]HEA63496.1 hypothetical protein [Pseudohongiella sp.]
MLKLEFERSVDKVLAQAHDSGILIDFGWTMPIMKAEAIEYCQTYNKAPNLGFYEQDGIVTLTHKGGKMAFSPQEAAAIVDLIKAAYL